MAQGPARVASGSSAWVDITGKPSTFPPAAHTQAASTISDASTVGQNLVTLTNPSAITFTRINADNTVSALAAADFVNAIGGADSTGTGGIVRATSATLNTPVIAAGTGGLAWEDSAGVIGPVLYRDVDGAWHGNREIRLQGTYALFGKLGSSATENILATDVVGDTHNRFVTQVSGAMYWGPGNGSADLTLLRSGVGQMQIGGNVSIVGDLSAASYSAGLFLSTVADGTSAAIFRGASKAVRVVPSPSGVSIEGVDYTAFSSYEPLALGGSSVSATISGTTKMLLNGSGMLRLHSYGAGTLVTDSSGNVTASSDASLKNVTGDFTRGLADVLKLTPRTYHWNDKSGMNTEDENVGFIAQEVLTAVPEAVGRYRTTESDVDGKKTKKREKAELLTLSDRPIIAALVNAVKELKAENDDLRARVFALENGKAKK